MSRLLKRGVQHPPLPPPPPLPTLSHSSCLCASTCACRLSDPQYAAWEDALDQLPKYAVAAGRGELRAWLLSLPAFPTEAAVAGGSDELWRTYLLLSFLAHVSQ